MDTKRMVTNAILIALGAILHQITPGTAMQPDLSVAMLFIIMVYNRSYKTILICGIIVGVFAALTTKTAGGQLPNIIDKVVTANVMFLVLMPLRNKISRAKQILMVLPIGTLLSGTVFLMSMIVLSGLEASYFPVLFISVVLTTAILNVILGFILFKIVDKCINITGAYSVER